MFSIAKNSRFTAITVSLLLLWGVSSLSAEKRVRDNFPELLPGIPRRGAIRIQSNAWYDTYRIRIPQDAVGVTLRLNGAGADLDLYLRFGSPMQDYSEADVYSEQDLFNEVMQIYRYDEIGLENGYAYVDVAYMLEKPPVSDQKVMKTIPYTISFELVTGEQEEALEPGDPVSGVLQPESFMQKIYPVRIPGDADKLRVDLYNSSGDLDVMVTDSPVAPADAHPLYLAETVAGNESFVMDIASVYRGETLYLTVFDSIASDREQTFSLVAGFEEAAPEFLNVLPALPVPRNPFENALYSTVEILTPESGGSGAVLSDRGVILTNYHVLAASDGGYYNEVTVAVVQKTYAPAVESYTARVLAVSEDLDCAILQIVRGYYGQEIPDDYVFPYFSLVGEEELSMGDEINILGFPTIGGSGSRATINLSRGILAGGENISRIHVLKTDAMISGGNSGGAAMDSSWRLLGIPSFVIEEDTESMGYIIPLSTVPAEWFERYLP